MSGGGAEFEYPDEAGYPDGMGTLHEGTDEQDAGAPGGDQGAASGAAADEAANEIDDFAMQDEEDVDEDV